jgi:hypothetical protein
MDIATILASGEYTMLLVRTAKKYILNGGNPATCTSCLRDYHKKIIMKADLIKKVETRTCVPKFKGKMYIPSVVKDGETIALCAHIAAEYLTDEKAIEYLELGALKESHFAKLPDGYKEEKKKPGRKPKTEDKEKAE